MTDLEISFVSDQDEESMHHFVTSSLNGTFYHEITFSRIYSFKTREIINLLFRKRDRWVAALPGGIVEEGGFQVFQSPFSASFAGFCYSEDMQQQDALEAIKLLEKYCMNSGIRKIVLQHPPIIYGTRPDERLDYALISSGFTLANADLTYYLQSLAGIAPAGIRNVKKAVQAGLLFAETDDIGEVWSFLQQQKSKKGFSMSISADELSNLKQGFGSRVRLFSVRKEHKIVAALILYALNKKVAMGFSWAHDEGVQELRPTDYLLYCVAELVFTEGFSYLDLGTGTIGGEPVWGVIRFKEKFGAQSVLRKKYVKQLT